MSEKDLKIKAAEILGYSDSGNISGVVYLVDRLMDVNHQLADENEKLRNQIQNQNKNKKTDIER